MALLTPPPAAPQRGDRTTFANRVDAFITWLINFVSELIALVANLNSIAAGGAYAIPYTNVSSIAQIGAAAGGKICINNDTDLRLDTKDSRGANVAGLLNQMNASSSAVKGTIRIFALADPSRWIDYNIISYTQNAGGLYGVATMAFVNSSAGGSNPLLAGEMVMLDFDRNGDKGDAGPAGSQLTQILQVREQYAAGSSGPAVTSGTSTCALNTLPWGTITGASLASNQVTLPAGTYNLFATVTLAATGARFKGLLYNVTDGANLLHGSSEYIGPNQYINSGKSIVQGRFTLSAQKTIELRRFTDTSGTAGNAVNSGIEVYSEAIFTKVA